MARYEPTRQTEHDDLTRDGFAISIDLMGFIMIMLTVMVTITCSKLE